MSTETSSRQGLNFEFTEEQQMLREMVHKFTELECPKNLARDMEAAHEFPWVLQRKIADAGLYGIGVSEQYGGQGGDVIDQVIVCEELARTLAGLSVLWHLQAWSGIKAIATHGTQAQRDEFLPKIAAGKLLFAFAMTEPGGGTDVLRAMRTRARAVQDGYVLNGTKIWSTIAHVANYLLVLARSSDHDKPSRGLTVFLVDAKSKGIVARPIPKLGLRSLGSCEVQFEDVFVPAGNVIGEVDNGWAQTVGSLNSERIMTAAMCMGMLKGVLEDAIAYAKGRHAFGRPIGSMQAIQHKIANMAMNLETSRLHTYRAATMLNEGRPCGVESTMAKCLAAEYAVSGADDGIQILGGYGYAEEYNMQRYWRDARLFRIGPITTEMCLNYIGESLGLPRSF
ncbi:MAG TPA: acyl-CoA dehydrogenase family protein [Steroidobacteraceae bacterium]|jgi:alkylation response protein AidB-like acyl-CoA dehydrogenase